MNEPDDKPENAIRMAEPPEHEQRSIMAELLTPEEIRHLEIAEGRWFLPGPPP